MKKFLRTVTIVLLLAFVFQTSHAQGQINVRTILEQIIRNQNQNQNQNGNRQQIPQRPDVRQPLVVGQPAVVRQPNVIRQAPQVVPRGAFPAQRPIQNYVLTAGGIETAATFDGTSLIVYSGEDGYRYLRRPDLDTRDGQFLGFANQTLSKSLRFPINGGNRIQVGGPRNTWVWSEMKVGKAVAQVAVEDLHAQIDSLAFNIQEQARQLAAEANKHCRQSPHYGYLISDTSAMLKQSMHLHDVAYGHGDLNQLGVDLAELDKCFHHLEETFSKVEREARRDRSHSTRVKKLLKSTESNIHQLSDIVARAAQPVITGPPFGTCSNIDPLVHQLEDAVNELLLDMHYNYCENPKFDSAYKKTYRLLTAAQEVHEAAHKNRQGKMKRTLKGLDRLTCQLQNEFRTWTCQAQYRCGIGTLRQKLSTVQWILLDLMHDAGVEPTELRYLAGRNLVAPPIAVPPRPR